MIKYIKYAIATLAVVLPLSFFMAGCIPMRTTNIEEIEALGTVKIIGQNVDSTGKPSDVSIGTGFFIGDNTIVSVNHVVANHTKLYIQAKDNPKAYSASIIGSDPFSDVAVVKIDDWDSFHKENKIVKFNFGKTNDLQLGDRVVVVGNPNDYGWTVSEGVVSYKNRHDEDNMPFPYLQVDAAILHGNSGGPVFDKYGRVIGISDLLIPVPGGFPNPLEIPDAVGGMGLAIQAEVATKVINDILKDTPIEWPLVGMYATHDLADLYYKVDKVNIIGSAIKAGIQSGDYLISLVTKNTPQAGIPISDFSVFRDNILYLDKGDTITVNVQRDGKPKSFTFALTDAQTSDQYKKDIKPPEEKKK